MDNNYEFKIATYRELVEKVYIYLKEHNLIPISENRQNINNDFYQKTEQLLNDAAITEKDKAELEKYFSYGKYDDEILAWLAGVYLISTTFEAIYRLKNDN